MCDVLRDEPNQNTHLNKENITMKYVTTFKEAAAKYFKRLNLSTTSVLSAVGVAALLAAASSWANNNIDTIKGFLPKKDPVTVTEPSTVPESDHPLATLSEAPDGASEPVESHLSEFTDTSAGIEHEVVYADSTSPQKDVGSPCHSETMVPIVDSSGDTVGCALKSRSEGASYSL